MTIPRMTTRRWMIVVALAGAVLGTLRMWQMRVRYQRLAATHARYEAAYARQADEFAKQARWATWDAAAQYPLTIPDQPWHQVASESRNQADLMRRLATHESRMKFKFDSAARRPWLPVPPDPPEPK